MLFDHIDQLVFTNVPIGILFGQPAPDTVSFGGMDIPSATVGHPDTVTYWLLNSQHQAQQITEDQDFVQKIVNHVRFGDPVSMGHNVALDALGLGHDYRVSVPSLYNAVVSMPTVAASIVASGYTEEQILGYIESVAPGVIDYVGQGANTDPIFA